jgi:hypothetical protein
MYLKELTDALRHSSCCLFAHCAILAQQFRLYTQELYFDPVVIGDKASRKPVRRTGQTREICA